MHRIPARKSLIVALSALFAAGATQAFAHTGIEHSHGTGFSSGLAHPIGGVDHLLAMFAVGLWAAYCGGRMTWALPATFVSVMIAAAAIGIMGVPLPFVESGIAASVLVLGLLTAFALKPHAAASLGLIGLFAVFHGHAHGAELAAGLSAAGYVVGFALSTAAIHGAGIGFGLFGKSLEKQQSRAIPVYRVSGGLIFLCGTAMLAGLL